MTTQTPIFCHHSAVRAILWLKMTTWDQTGELYFKTLIMLSTIITLLKGTDSFFELCPTLTNIHLTQYRISGQQTLTAL